MRWLVLLALLPGCPMCEWDTELDVVKGSSVMHAGERVTLELDSNDYYAGPDKCRGHWYVDDIEGGNAEVGIVTRCGEYISTPWPHTYPYRVVVSASQYPPDTCLDCCPWEMIELTVLERSD